MKQFNRPKMCFQKKKTNREKGHLEIDSIFFANRYPENPKSFFG